MNMFYRRGFTVIELLVAIAVIGVLASVILPRMQTTRDQAVEAKIISELESFNKQGFAEEMQSGSFNVVCGQNGFATATNMLPLVDSLRQNSLSFVCYSTTDSFAASAQLNPTTHWCVDSSGVKKETTTALASGSTACP